MFVFEGKGAKAYSVENIDIIREGEDVLVKGAVFRLEDCENLVAKVRVFDESGENAETHTMAINPNEEGYAELNVYAKCKSSVEIDIKRGKLILSEGERIPLYAVEGNREERNFNRDWVFAYGEVPNAEKVEFNADDWCNIGLPHSFSIPYDINDESFYIGKGWYRKEFNIPSTWTDKIISLNFDGVFQRADIYVNGVKIPRCKVYGYETETDKSLPTHEGGYSAFSVDITDFVNVGKANLVAVKVDNIWQPDLVPRGGDHQFSGGIYRDVTLSAVSRTHIDWYGTFVWTPAICNPSYQVSENRPDELYNSDFERYGTGIVNTLDDPSIDGEYVSEDVMLKNIENRTSDVEIQAEITNTLPVNIELYMNNRVISPQGEIVCEFKSETVGFKPRERKLITARSEMIENIMLWDFENPNLYRVETEVFSVDGTRVDTYETTFGFRSAQFKLEGFFLNGKKTLLDGANVHQDHGGWADAVTDAGFYRDVKYVKEAGFNFIRGSHYPHDIAFAESCDKLGIGFWCEGGLWSIGGFNDGDSTDEKTSDWTRSAYPINEKYCEKFEKSCFDIVRSMIRVNRNSPSVIVWSMGNEAFFSNDIVTDKVKNLINRLRNYAHGLDYTRKAGLGGTQRKDLNVLAVCDVAGGNGDGGTARYTNFYLPHMVAEYSSGSNDRPGVENFQYGEIKDADDDGKYVLPEKTIVLNDGTTVESQSAGLSIWCMYHHGSVGGRGLRTMGLMDYYRLPTARYFMYRNDRCHTDIFEKSLQGKASHITLQASTDIILKGAETENKTVITNDGKTDVQIVLTMTDEMGNWVDDNLETVIKVVEGNGVFPTGKEYRFIPGKTIQDGKASIEFRSYYSGESKIQAYVPGTSIKSDIIAITTLNPTGDLEGEEKSDFMLLKKRLSTVRIQNPEVYGKIDVALNRQSRADSFTEALLPVKAIDGKADTYWESEVKGSGQSWWVFLENSYYIYSVKVNTPSNNFDLFYKADNGEWAKIANYTDHKGSINLSGIYTNGLKITFNDTKDDEHARLYGFNAYGTAFCGYSENGVFLKDVEPIETSEPGVVVYRLDEKYSRFTAISKIDTKVCSYNEAGVTEVKVVGLVKTDGGVSEEIILWEEKLTEVHKEAYVDISVTGVYELKLISSKKFPSEWSDGVLWGALRDISISDENIVLGKSDGYLHVRAEDRYEDLLLYLIKTDEFSQTVSMSEGYRFEKNVISVKADSETVGVMISCENGQQVGYGLL